MIELVTLEPSEYLQITELLIPTFWDQPYMHYLFRTQGEKRERDLRLFFDILMQMYIDTQQPVLGLKDGDRLIGAAVLVEPEAELPWLAFAQLLFPLGLRSGFPAFWRILSSFWEQEKYKIHDPHYYISFLVVHPDYQGQGGGRILMNEIHRISASHPISVGTWVETEVPENISFYQHFNYQTQTTLDTEGVIMYLLFRPNEA